MKKEHAFNFAYMAIALIAIAFLRDFWIEQQKVGQIAYINPAVSEKPEFITDKLEPGVADFRAKYKIKYKAEHDSGGLKAILSWVVPTALFAGFWIFVIRRMQGGAGSAAEAANQRLI